MNESVSIIGIDNLKVGMMIYQPASRLDLMKHHEKIRHEQIAVNSVCEGRFYCVESINICDSDNKDGYTHIVETHLFDLPTLQFEFLYKTDDKIVVLHIE